MPTSDYMEVVGMSKKYLWLLIIAVVILLSACPPKVVNTPPTLTVPEQTVKEGNTLSLDLSTYATDAEGDAITFTLKSGVGSLVGGVYTYQPDFAACPSNKQYETKVITVEAKDTKGSASTSNFNIKVENVNRTPTITIPDQQIQEGLTLNLDLTTFASDLDTDDVLSFTLTGVGGLSGTNNSQYSFTAPADSGGTVETVTIKVRDLNLAEAQDTFEIIIVDVNASPNFFIPNQTVNEGQTLTLNLSNYANDPNGDPLTFTKVDGVGTVLGTTYTYKPDYDEAGTRFSKLQASDGVNPPVEAIFYIEVIDVNRIPNQITNMKPANGALSQAYTNLVFSWNCTDPDGDPLKYDFYIGTSPNPISTYLIHRPDLTTPTTQVNLSRETRYYWQVVAKDGKGGERKSAVYHFWTIPRTILKDDFSSYPYWNPLPSSFGSWKYFSSGSGAYMRIYSTGYPNYNGAYIYDVSNSNYTYLVSNDYNNFESGTLEFDFRCVHSYSNINVYIYGGPGSGVTFGLRWIGGALRLFVIRNGVKTYLSTISLNTWYTARISFNFISNLFYLYLDGSYKGWGNFTANYARRILFTTSTDILPYYCIGLTIDDVILKIDDVGYVP